VKRSGMPLKTEDGFGGKETKKAWDARSGEAEGVSNPRGIWVVGEALGEVELKPKRSFKKKGDKD